MSRPQLSWHLTSCPGLKPGNRRRTNEILVSLLFRSFNGNQWVQRQGFRHGIDCILEGRYSRAQNGETIDKLRRFSLLITLLTLIWSRSIAGRLTDGRLRRCKLRIEWWKQEFSLDLSFRNPMRLWPNDCGDWQVRVESLIFYLRRPSN